MTRVVFDSNRSGNSDIYSMNRDGSDVVQLTADPSDDFGPAVSPDGTRIAFWSKRDGNQQIYVMNADGSDQTRLTNNPQADNPHTRWPPDWSPDGTQVAYETNEGFDAACNCTSIYVMNSDGTNARRITNRAEGLDAGPDWSPDGRWIAFARQELTEDSPYPEIWTVRANGRPRERRLTTNESYEWSPAWSPDGTHILFQSNRPDPKGRFSLFVMRPDGTRARRVTRSEGWDDSQPAWSATGRRIVFVRDPDGAPYGFGCFGGVETCIVQVGPQPGDLWIARADGSRARVVGETPFEEGSPNLVSTGG